MSIMSDASPPSRSRTIMLFSDQDRIDFIVRSSMNGRLLTHSNADGSEQPSLARTAQFDRASRPRHHRVATRGLEAKLKLPSLLQSHEALRYKSRSTVAYRQLAAAQPRWQ